MPASGLKHCLLTRGIQMLLRSVLLLSTLPALSQGQITLDGSLGLRGPLPGPNYRIDANVGQIRGSNLFHSFGQFNVRTDESATFAGPNTITNVVGRVTGGEPSLIDGRLRSEIAGANLFLLNPSGVMFGPKASLEVSGSFHVSTADFLRFADGAKFFANLGQESVLTVAPPAAFGFLGNNPAAISIQGSSLKVSEGKTLSAVGGDITIVGNGPLTTDSAPTLSAPGGRIQLASVASPGEVVFSRLDLSPDLQAKNFTRLGRLELSQGAFLDASANGGGSVLLRSGRLRVDGSEIFADNNGPVNGTGLGIDLQVSADAVITNDALLTADSLGAGRARDLRLTAGSVQIDNSTVGSRAFEGSRGNAGSIAVQAGRLTLSGGAQIDSGTRSVGRGGELAVTATEAIAIAGQSSGLFSNTFDLGDAGRLSISTPLLTMDAGLIQANAELGSRGNAGSLEARVGRLTLTGGAQLSSNTEGAGRGGTLTVKASEAISIAGRDAANRPSRVSTDTTGSGGAGRIVISAPVVEMRDGFIQARGLAGNAGDIVMEAGRLVLSEGAQIDSGIIPHTGTTRSQGGTLTVKASQSVAIAGEDSGLFANSFSSGAAGQIVISAPVVEMRDGLIQVRGAAGNAGDVVMEVGRLVLTEGAQISSSTGGAGRGGTVTIKATEAISMAGRDAANNPSVIFSNTTGSGAAGQIVIVTPTVEITAGAQIASVTEGTGPGGTVTVRANQSATIAREHSGLFVSGVAGNAGDIVMEVGRLVLTEGAKIDSTIGGAGRGGTITIKATEAIAIAGQDREGSPSGLSSGTLGSGDAGRLFISTPRLSLEAGQIQAGTQAGSSGNAGSIDVQVGRLMLSGGAQLRSNTFGEGRGGDITVVATEAIAIAGRHRDGSASGLFSATAGGGAGGSIHVRAGNIQLSGGGTIAASSFGAGDAGAILMQAGETFRSQNGAVTTAAEGAGGGSVELHAGRLVQLFDSELTTSVRGGGGNAGNLTLDAPFLVADNSQIVANAFAGRGGNIQITGGVFLADPTSLVSASSALGIQGTVDIRAPVTSLSGAVAPLPQAFVSAAALLPAQCAARLSGGRYSSLILGGRDGLPLDPSGVLPSPLILDESVGDPAVDGTPHQHKPPAKFALLAVAEKVFPRLHGGNAAWGCSE
jgi:filamentous hemagglutinin family protein